MDLAQMTAAGGSIVLGKEKRTLLLRRLDFRDQAQMQEYVRTKIRKPMLVVADALKDLEAIKKSDPEIYKQLADTLALKAMETERSKVVDWNAAQEVLLSEDGMAFHLWLRIRKEQPDVTCEQVKAWVHEEDPDELTAKWTEIMLRESPPESSDPTSPTTNGTPSSTNPT
jgi:hypothetical protein